MANDIEKFDPSKLMDGVKERIKSTFVSLIPDDAWDSMLEREIYTFTTGRIELKSDYERDDKGSCIRDEDGNYKIKCWEERKPYSQLPIKDQWGHLTGKDDISPLQQIIRDELRKKFHEDIVAYLNSDEYTAVRDQYGITVISKKIQEIVVENAGLLFQSVIAQFIQKGFEQMRYELSRVSQND